MQRGQALALVVHPLVEVPRHQLAAVQRRGLFTLPGAQQLLKAHCVAAQRSGRRTHAQAVGQHHHGAGHAGRLQHALQRRQHLAQAVAPHRQGDTGPQQFDQFFTRVRTVGRQRQARQQRGHRARRETVEPLHAVEGLDGTQQAHLPARFGSR